MKTDHLLIIRFSAMGDVAMLAPVVYALATQYPHIRVTVLSRPFARPFFDSLAPNVGFMAADLKGEYRGVKGLNALYRRLVAKNFTAIADMHNILRSNYLRMRFNLGRFRVEHLDKHRAARQRLTAQYGKRLAPLPTAFENYADVLRRLGYPVKLEFRSLFPPGGGDLRLIPNRVGEPVEGESWIGVAPFAAHAGKVYPHELMERAIQLMLDRHPQARLFLFGGGDKELRQLDTWAMHWPQAINASRLMGSLQQELILMSHLDVMISMDSANMHLASLVDTPVVSVWGATHPYAGFMGWGQDPDNAVQIDLPCRPCSIYGNKPCLRGDYSCLRRIEPAMIADRVDIVLCRAKTRRQAEKQVVAEPAIVTEQI